MQLENINEKKILFISPEFFSIDKKIIKVLKENGAVVTWFDERSVKSAFGRAINSVWPQIFTYQSNIYFRKNLEKINIDIDYILIIKGDMISKQTITLIRNRYPKAELILYLYDPIRNIKGITNKLKLYDRVISFEKEDCDKYGFEFRPLFCSIDGDVNDSGEKILNDICFYGTMYGDRFSVIGKMKEYCIKNGIRFFSFCFLRGKFMALYYYITNSGFRKLGIDSISFIPKSTKEIAEIVAHSKAILDVNDIHQKGLTIRTLETLISGKKLITTNSSIREYDLFDAQNVSIIDRNEINVDISFLEMEPKKIPQDIIDKYTAEGWVRDVFK